MRWSQKRVDEAKARLQKLREEWETEMAQEFAPSDRPPLGEQCEICGRTDELLNWDHDHSTGLFRGWLCRRCNTGIGLLHDDPTVVEAALFYLEGANRSHANLQVRDLSHSSLQKLTPPWSEPCSVSQLD